jgi:hypothetical protein
VRANSLELQPLWPSFVGPLVGAAGAILLYMMFRSGLLTGELSPSFRACVPNNETLCTITGVEEAKLMVWSFIAGFSEKFVPLTLHRLGNKNNVDTDEAAHN